MRKLSVMVFGVVLTFTVPASAAPNTLFNGAEIDKVVFNGTEVEKVLLGSTVLFTAAPVGEDDSWVVYNQASDFQYITNNSAITITNYVGASASVNIPKQINGFNVEVIRTNAVTSKSVKSVYVPATVKRIELQAFYNCNALTNVYIADGATELGDYVFGQCFELKRVKLSEAVTNTGIRLFSNCSKLPFVKLPAAMPHMRDFMFSGCNSLTNIDFGGVKLIGRYSFSSGCNVLTNLVFPASVTGLEHRAVFECTGLTNAVFGNSDTVIGSDNFSGCSALARVTLPANLARLEDYVFYNCVKLTKIGIPATVTMIRRYAFYGCTSLYAAYFWGNQPPYDPYGGWFGGCTNINYRFEYATGWPEVPGTYLNRPTALWTSPLAGAGEPESPPAPPAPAKIPVYYIAGPASDYTGYWTDASDAFHEFFYDQALGCFAIDAADKDLVAGIQIVDNYSAGGSWADLTPFTVLTQYAIAYP